VVRIYLLSFNRYRKREARSVFDHEETPTATCATLMNVRLKKTSTFAALQNPVYRRLWLAILLSGTCVSAQDTAATWTMNKLGASTFVLSLITTVTLDPGTYERDRDHGFPGPAGRLNRSRLKLGPARKYHIICCCHCQRLFPSPKPFN